MSQREWKRRRTEDRKHGKDRKKVKERRTIRLAGAAETIKELAKCCSVWQKNLSQRATSMPENVQLERSPQPSLPKEKE